MKGELPHLSASFPNTCQQDNISQQAYLKGWGHSFQLCIETLLTQSQYKGKVGFPDAQRWSWCDSLTKATEMVEKIFIFFRYQFRTTGLDDGEE